MRQTAAGAALSDANGSLHRQSTAPPDECRATAVHTTPSIKHGRSTNEQLEAAALILALCVEHKGTSGAQLTTTTHCALLHAARCVSHLSQSASRPSHALHHAATMQQSGGTAHTRDEHSWTQRTQSECSDSSSSSSSGGGRKRSSIRSDCDRSGCGSRDLVR